ncbi:MAG TPA: class I SAM-dependent rRNA methyltransferase [Terriglobia bacterium]|nr:class I SAM-dependent rRNA methyltransferase [Terriglobia bacterium]
MELEVGEVRIRRRGVERVRRGHVWIYRGDVVSVDTEPGAVTAVRDERGALVGKAFYSGQSQIALRLVARGPAVVDAAFFRRRLAAATTLRARLGVDPMFSRRVYAEGDFFPGLIVDRYGDRLVVQSLIQASDRLEPLITEVLQEEYQPRSILFRNDNKVRELEGLPLEQRVRGEPIPEIITIRDDGKDLHVALAGGQKTGGYFDQRENRRAAARYARGRALDAFSYVGGFALHLADVCAEVEAVEISAAAARLATRNVESNHIPNVRVIQANVFDFLREQFSAGVRYDTIVLDPPAFAKNKDSIEAALRGYREINNRAMRLLSDGGILVTCSCSHHISEGLFAEMLAEAATDAGRRVRVLERRMQAPDHPVVLTIPETLYLKCFVLEILY